MQKQHKLSVLEKIGFGAGDAAVNVVISSMMLIIGYFYTDVFGLEPADLVVLFFVVRMLDGLIDPLIGWVNDRFTTRWGRYRPYFLIVSVPLAISTVLMFTTPDLSYQGKLLWAYATYILNTILFSLVTVPYISLIGVLTDSTAERLSANGYRLFFAKVAGFCVAIVVPLLAVRLGDGNLARGYQLAMTIMAVAGVALFLFCFFTTTERVVHTEEKMPFRVQWRHLLRNDQWLILCAVCMTGMIGYVVRGQTAAYYAKYYLGGGEALISRFMGVGVFAAILSMVASTWITKRICKIQLFRWTQIAVGGISALMLVMVKPGDVNTALVLYFILSFVVDLHAPIFWSVIPESVDYGAYKTGVRVSGLAIGLIAFCQSLGLAIAGSGTNKLLDHFGYVANQEQTPEALRGIALMLTIIPGAFHILVGVLMLKYRVTDRFYGEMQKARPEARGVPAVPVVEPPLA
jgi:glycoside/pentoside/hexuronide:cation symporter, GPH family